MCCVALGWDAPVFFPWGKMCDTVCELVVLTRLLFRWATFFLLDLVNPQRCVFSLFICNLDLSQVLLIAIHPPWPHFSMPEDFPCAHPGCHHTFKCCNTGTQHYNAHHHPLSPDSEPDPAHQFHIKYYLKLNGTVCIQFILWKTPCSFHLIALPCNQDGKFLHQHA